MFLKIKPVTISIRSGNMIISVVVEWICDPRSSRSLINVKETHRSHNLCDQVVSDDIVSFDSILNENIVSLGFKGVVVDDSQVSCSMNSNSSII